MCIHRAQSDRTSALLARSVVRVTNNIVNNKCRKQNKRDHYPACEIYLPMRRTIKNPKRRKDKEKAKNQRRKQRENPNRPKKEKETRTETGEKKDKKRNNQPKTKATGNKNESKRKPNKTLKKRLRKLGPPPK